MSPEECNSCYLGLITAIMRWQERWSQDKHRLGLMLVNSLEELRMAEIAMQNVDQNNPKALRTATLTRDGNIRRVEAFKEEIRAIQTKIQNGDLEIVVYNKRML